MVTNRDVPVNQDNVSDKDDTVLTEHPPEHAETEVQTYIQRQRRWWQSLYLELEDFAAVHFLSLTGAVMLIYSVMVTN